MSTSLNQFLSQIAAPTEAAQWVASDHVTNLLDKWRKERFENMECACGNIVPAEQADSCLMNGEYICRECR